MEQQFPARGAILFSLTPFLQHHLTRQDVPLCFLELKLDAFPGLPLRHLPWLFGTILCLFVTLTLTLQAVTLFLSLVAYE